MFPSLGVIWVQISAPLTISDNIFRRGGQTDGQRLWDTSKQTLQHRHPSTADFTQKSNLRTQRTQGVTLQHSLYQFWRRTAPLFNPVWWILDCYCQHKFWWKKQHVFGKSIYLNHKSYNLLRWACVYNLYLWSERGRWLQ